MRCSAVDPIGVGGVAVVKSVTPGLRCEDRGSSCWRLPNAQCPNASRVLVWLRSRTASSVGGVSVKSHRWLDDLNFFYASICVEGDVAGAENLPIHTWPKTSRVVLVIGHPPAAAHHSLCSSWVRRSRSYRNECSKKAGGMRKCLHNRGVSTPTVTALSGSALPPFGEAAFFVPEALII